jgi:hypothetical protein
MNNNNKWYYQHNCTQALDYSRYSHSKTQNEIQNCREISRATTRLWDHLRTEHPGNRFILHSHLKDSHIKHLKYVVFSMLKVYIIFEQSRGLMYYRSSKYWHQSKNKSADENKAVAARTLKSSPENQIIDFRFVNDVVDALRNCDMIGFKKGTNRVRYKDMNGSPVFGVDGKPLYRHVSLCSKIQMNEKLYDFLHEESVHEAYQRVVEFENREPNQDLVVINIKDYNGKKVQLPQSEMVPTSKLLEMRKSLADYQRLLGASDIQWNGPIEALGERFGGFNTTRVRRIFNDREMRTGGRIYAGFHQNISHNKIINGQKIEGRKYITINGNPTVELDIRFIQPRILYAIAKKIDLQQDPYCDERTQWPRSLMKVVFQVLLNTDNRVAAIRGAYKALYSASKLDRSLIQYIPNENNKKLQSDKEFYVGKLLVDKVIRLTHPISSFYCTGAWASLQRIDSEICFNVIKRFTEIGIVVLTIHDSFITEQQHEELLRRVVHEECQRLLKIDINRETLLKKEY